MKGKYNINNWQNALILYKIHMVEITRSLKLKYKDNTFESAKLNYKWITDCISKLENINKLRRFEYMFYYGEFGNSGDSYDEFLSEGLDKNDFVLSYMHLFYENLYVSISKEDVYISSSDKVIIHDFSELLEKHELIEENTINVYNGPVINENKGIIATHNAQVVQGNNNVIQGGKCSNTNIKSINVSNSKISGGFLNSENEKKSIIEIVLNFIKNIFS